MKRINRRMFTVIFTIASILINCMCSYFAGLVAFPLYLDSLLTIAVTALCGLIPGIVCAIASNALLCIFANTGILFMLCHISTAVVAHLVFSSERKKAESPSNSNVPYTDVSYTTENFMWIGFISAVTNSVLGNTISYFFYSANTTIPQVDNAVQGIYVVTKSLKFAAYFGGTITNLIDKVFSATVSLFVYRFYKKSIASA
nr:hypothetical protein [uncultured Treponema sp.]